MRSCQYRQALNDGRIICRKITEGDPEVHLEVCRYCPVMAIHCEHLRFTLRKVGHKPILIRYGNGRSEIWDGDPPRVEFVQGACAEKVMPITSPRQCVGCAVRCPMRPEAVPIPQSAAARERSAAQNGNVIPFPERVSATG